MNALKLRSFFPSALLILTLVAPAVRGQGVADSLLLGARTIELAAKLSGFQQVPPVLSNGKGSFSAEIHDINSITFRLSYSGLSSPVTGAHVHFGQKGVNGGIIFFLCGGGPTAACPNSGTITGTITAADVSVLPSGNPDSVIPQGIQHGDLAGAIRAILNGDGYVNVHTQNFPAGEIRGQIFTVFEE
jgi:CHRD domain